MPTYHIHIQGLVQGVGYRPFVYRLAIENKLLGEVCNAKDGLHVFVNCEKETADNLFQQLVQQAPQHAQIKEAKLTLTKDCLYHNFQITESQNDGKANLLLTPDLAICPECLAELSDPNNQRYQYPFTTCLHCGPRYSLSRALPYDRQHTSMQVYDMCERCKNEYSDPFNRRHFSQINSCPDCAVHMQLFGSNRELLSTHWEEIQTRIQDALLDGKIIAAKGIGGYLLLCDATRTDCISLLRQRKHRPGKPLALMFHSIESIEELFVLNRAEREELLKPSAPIVLLKPIVNAAPQLPFQSIAPNLNRIGVMLAYTPLLQLISKKFNKPLIATSGNISGSPILYQDDEALEHLGAIADYILCFKRDILSPQDDSLVQFSRGGQKIILRRSRGLAPNYSHHPFAGIQHKIWALGSEMKSSFALLDQPNLYLSQYLGKLGSLESQETYTHTLTHLSSLIESEPDILLGDMHPLYFTSEFGKELAQQKNIPFIQIQHHKAHFAAVLAEHDCLDSPELILGVVWDGTGYGEDGNSWGGEIFKYDGKQIEPLIRLDYFPQLLGDKMSKEPRLSALSLLSCLETIDKESSYLHRVKHAFTEQEWQYYRQLSAQKHPVYTSSMGRLIDGVAALLGVCQINTYEGQAAMELEALAYQTNQQSRAFYTIETDELGIHWQTMISELLADLDQGKTPAFIAFKFWNSLARLPLNCCKLYPCWKVAFSGGVFQNALLCDLITRNLSDTHALLFHQEMSPNDECISFGQLAAYSLIKKHEITNFEPELI